MVVAHNLSAMNTQRQFGIVDKSRAKSTEKLSSGYKINRAADDAAGLSISEKMRRQVRGLNQSKYNIQEGVGLCQTRDGALGEVQDMLHRMNELAVKSANGTLTSTDRSYIQAEVDNLTKEINRIGKTTTFNEIKIFDYENIVTLPGQKATVGANTALGTGYLTDAYKDPKDGMWHPSANLDFKGVKADNIQDLYDKSFSFTCSQACDEAFKFTFVNKDPNAPAFSSDLYGEKEHKYEVNIAGLKTGAEVLDQLFKTVANNMPSRSSSPGTTPIVESQQTDLVVSHSNRMVRTGTTTISLVSDTKKTTQKAAEENFLNKKGSTSKYAKADVSAIKDLLIAEKDINVLPIQSSTEASRFIYISMEKMNAKLLDVEPLDVSTEEAAGVSIDRVKYALEQISRQRSDAGAEQNRLEHAYKINDNSQENTTAAESAIRDTDMATEMVNYSLKNILTQSGQSMMAQANQSNQGVLSLLQG